MTNRDSAAGTKKIIVRYEGKSHYGKTEIQQWNEMTSTKNKTKYEPLEVTIEGDKIILTAKFQALFHLV